MVIGLEVHVQLKTASKIFCGCSTRFGDPPNTHTCPVCLGLPGALPVLNRKAVELAVRAALALNCEVQNYSRFARKNYFYPDLPKGYQISQYELPLARAGWIEIEVAPEAGPAMGGAGAPALGVNREQARKRIGITRLHLEEDAGKSLHEGFPDSDMKSYIDFNRCGVPLVEIVSEPDMRSPEEAYAYLSKLKQVLEYAEVSDCNMEEGSLRCDANLSLRPMGSQELGVKQEIKNLNSFRFVKQALWEKAKDLKAKLDAGEAISLSTSTYDPSTRRLIEMRIKEEAHDYRYFPEPDLLPLIVSEAWREEIRRSMPELPDARKARFLRDYGLSDYDAEVLTGSRALGDYFEAVVKGYLAKGGEGAPPKSAANWIQTELLGLLRNAGKEISDSPVSPAALAELLRLIEENTLTGKMAKDVFAKMFSTGERAAAIIEREGVTQISDVAVIEQVCRDVIAANPSQYAEYRKGKTALLAFFVGQVMRATRGQANPQLVNDLLKRLLAE
jgi:aspartyl-tRNA(Asn)/glutamyl-tRNA(Gln) amidotransferase subunit B